MTVVPPSPRRKGWWGHSLGTSAGSWQQRLQMTAPTCKLPLLEDFIIILKNP